MLVTLILISIFNLSPIRALSTTTAQPNQAFCNLVTDCSTCYRFPGCEWCQTPTNKTFCALPGQCSPPSSKIGNSCFDQPTRELCSAKPTPANCVDCLEADCYWSYLPFGKSETGGHCVSNQTPTSNQGSSVWELTTEECNRCNYNRCGDCVDHNLCGWCQSGNYCFDLSDQNQVQLCQEYTATDCNGCQDWTNCVECRTRGCAWCDNTNREFCFDPISPAQVSSCLQQPDYQFASTCTGQFSQEDTPRRPASPPISSPTTKDEPLSPAMIVAIVAIVLAVLIIVVLLILIIVISCLSKIRR